MTGSVSDGIAAGPGRLQAGSALLDWLVAASLAVLVWLLYGNAVRLWWTLDDLFVLHTLLRQPPPEFWSSPGFWRSLPFRLFVPLLFFSYKVDAATFGIRPSPFYVHQLLACAVAVASLFAVFRKWFSTLLAGAGALLFTLGVPFVAWAQELMLRHYIEGFVLAALATWFFVESLRGRRPMAVQALSAVLYLFAMLAKEVYVPLPAFFVLLHGGSFASRLQRLRLHAMALVAYLGWRRAMIGAVAGGYGWTNRSDEWPGLIAGLPGKLGATLVSGTWPWDTLLVCVLIAGFLCHFRRGPHGLGLIVGSMALLIAPIVPVARAVNARFGTLPWVLVIAVFISGCARLAAQSPRGRAAAAALLGVAATACFFSNRIQWDRQFREAWRMSEEGRFFLSMAPGDLLAHPRIADAAMEETRWIKEEYLHLPKGSGWFADDIYLCGNPSPAGRIWEYDGSTGGFRDLTAGARAAAARYCSSLRPGDPLRARFELSGGALSWRLGPWEAGQYSLVGGKGRWSIAVPREGGYRTAPALFSVMVRYQSPTGRVTYSPELTMDFRLATRYGWSRPAAIP